MLFRSINDNQDKFPLTLVDQCSFALTMKEQRNKRIRFIAIDSDPPMVRGSDLLIESISRTFNNQVFGVPGDRSIHFVVSASRAETLDSFFFPQDHSAVLAAEALSYYTKKAHLVFLGSEDGATHAISAIVNCFKDSTPLVVVKFYDVTKTDNVNVTNDFFSKNIDLESISKTIFKKTIQVSDVNFCEGLDEVLKKAKVLAEEGRPGPVLVKVGIQEILRNYPKHELSSKVSDDGLSTARMNIGRLRESDLPTCNAIMERVFHAKKPLIVFGRGVDWSLTRSEINRIVSNFTKLRVPICTTRSAIDLIPSKSANGFGRVGTYGNRFSNKILQQSDLVIFIGAKGGLSITGRSQQAFIRDTYKCFINQENEHPLASVGNCTHLKMDAGEFLEKMLMNTDNYSVDKSWFNYCEYLRSFSGQKDEDLGFFSHSNVQSVLNQLIETADNDAIFCVDGGALLHHFTQTANLKECQRVIMSSSMESCEIGRAHV